MRLLSLGQILRVQVEETLAAGVVLVSVEGELLRVRNETGFDLRPGDEVEVLVTAVRPPQFRLKESKSNRLDRLV